MFRNYLHAITTVSATSTLSSLRCSAEVGFESSRRTALLADSAQGAPALLPCELAAREGHGRIRQNPVRHLQGAQHLGHDDLATSRRVLGAPTRHLVARVARHERRHGLMVHLPKAPHVRALVRVHTADAGHYSSSGATVMEVRSAWRSQWPSAATRATSRNACWNGTGSLSIEPLQRSSDNGGNSDAVKEQLSDWVEHVIGNRFAFTAVKQDGSMVTCFVWIPGVTAARHQSVGRPRRLTVLVDGAQGATNW